ncbi:DNA polymerase III subunit gamma and tau, partial [Streptomyces eurythermus]
KRGVASGRAMDLRRGGRLGPAAAPAPAPQAPAPAPTGGLDPRALWPNILETVKNRRRFTWILLSQNAQVTGFDGTTLQLGFVNAGARDNFASSGSEDVLRQALAEQFNVQWKIEAVVDPSGGGAPQAPVGASGYGGSPAGGYGSAPGGGYGAPAAPRPAAPQAAAQAPAATRNSAPAAPAPAPAPQPAAAPEPPPVAPEDDIPEDDDPDLDESALSGHELIVRELGATVVEEFTNE